MSQIRCKHERPGGSLVTFSFPERPDYREYHFKPAVKDGPHVAEVGDEGDVATLLAIESAYEPYTPGEEVGPASTPEPRTKTVLPAPKRDTTLFLDEMDEAALRTYAEDRFPALKLDPAHSADQLRTYLRGLLTKER